MATPPGNRAPEDPAALRAQAEASLQRRPARATDPATDPAELLHELEVHQIELELQNDELRRSQVELDAARATYFDLYDLAPVGYLTLSDTNRIGQANLTATTLLGVDRSALLGQPLMRFLAPEDQDTYYMCRRRLLATRTPQSCEVRLAQQEGAPPVWVRLNVNLATPMPDSPWQCRVALSDITERKRVETALHAANEGLEQRGRAREAALASANADLRTSNVELAQETSARQHAERRLTVQTGQLADHAKTLDLAHILIRDQDSRIVVWTAGMERLYGWTKAEAVGQVSHRLFQTTFPVSRDAYEATLFREGQWEGELIHTAKYGQRITVASHHVLHRDDQGRSVAILEVNTDITALKLTETALHRALADKDALLREVHHRVKNNLQMLCDLMYLQMEAMPDRDQHQDLQDAYSRIYAIARLHEQIYRSMQSGQIQLTEYLRRLVDGFTHLYPDVPVTVEAASVDVLLDLDRAIHVGLVVNELLTNAIKHAFPAGQPGAVIVTVSAAGEQISLRVRDNGRGLPADFDLEHAKSLGLRTVHILARRLEAQVTVTGDGGTSFTLTFPAHADPPLEPKLG